MARSESWFIRQIATGGTPANVLWWDWNDNSPPTQASSSSIWTVGKIGANNYSPLNNGSTQGTATFTTTIVPAATATAVTNSFTTTGYTPPNLLLDTTTISTMYEFNGYFPAGNWVFTFPVVASTVNSQQGAITMRVWKATRGAGNTWSGVTELTGALQTGTTVTVTATAASSVVTWAAPAFYLNNEFLICDIAWKIVVAGGNNACNVILRHGSGCTMVSPAARERVYNVN